MGNVVVFIDGAYLSKEFKNSSIDFKKLTDKLVTQSGDLTLLRAYYYDCPPYQSSPPTQEEKERYAKKMRFFKVIDSIPRFQVRKGKLAFRGYRKDGDPIFTQKRVDILFGVDLVSLALKGKISTAVILAGDSDFIPAIKVAKREGVIIHLYHGGSCHNELWQEADERTEIDDKFLEGLELSAEN